MARALLTVAVVACLALSAAAYERAIVEDISCNPPSAWVDQGRAPATDRVRLTFAVKQQNKEELLRVLMDVSDPDRVETYGKHLTMLEAQALVAPLPQAVASVHAWLLAHRVREEQVSATPGSDFIMADVDIATAEAMLDAEYHVYKHLRTGRVVRRLARFTGYSVPVAVAEHLDFVAPTTRFPRVEHRISAVPAHYRNTMNARAIEENAVLFPEHRKGNGTLIVVPSWLRQLYQAQDAFGKPGSANQQGVAGFIQQFYSPNDLQEFFGLFFNSSKGQTVYKQVGKNDPSNVGAEASLDIQYIMSVGANISSWVWYTGNNDNPFLDFFTAVAGAQDTPNLFSISYGEYENGITKAYAERVGVELQKVGARGISVLVASGDSGTGGNCTNSGVFSPDFPAACPYITAVGGMTGGDAGKTPTGEVGDLISGGGFSQYFDRPSYQDDAVKNFFAHNKSIPSTKYFNPNGAGYPDIAAQSEMFTIVVDMIPLPGVAGTSCATPTAAGIFSLLNDRRIAAGKPALGYLNPLIYKTAASTPNSFNDALTGTNVGCNLFGFTCVPGWDPVTGWGSPNYRILSAIVDALP